MIAVLRSQRLARVPQMIDVRLRRLAHAAPPDVAATGSGRERHSCCSTVASLCETVALVTVQACDEGS